MLFSLGNGDGPSGFCEVGRFPRDNTGSRRLLSEYFRSRRFLCILMGLFCSGISVVLFDIPGSSGVVGWCDGVG